MGWKRKVNQQNFVKFKGLQDIPNTYIPSESFRYT